MAEDKKSMNIELSPETARGKYSNLAIITHSPSEFIMDFVEILPGMPKPEVQSRIVMSPEHAKRLLMALQDNIQKYEANVRKIELPAPNNPIPPMGFGGEA